MEHDNVGELISEARRRLHQADGTTNLELLALFDGVTAGLLGVMQELKEVRKALESKRDA